ncbi:fimbrial protein [Solimicrobium silvestre]|uniref:Fimbrial protein n=1 Tax=Solimicrobium silvestre TaxID=2099400 RepID=A0A2S9GW56_9BURK|nr:fimbrial protein [Solimicrobium silvestre]PRC91952.1 Fimbrial protein [Solimicrobium silvestre]
MIKFTTVLNFILCVLAFSASNALATNVCKLTQSTFQMPFSLSVAQDAPVGTQIGPDIETGPLQLYTCTGNYSSQSLGLKPIGGVLHGMINGRRVFKTGIAGIGYALGLRSIGNCDGSSAYLDGVEFTSERLGPLNRLFCTYPGLMPVQPMRGQFLLAFYKIGATNGGSLASYVVGASVIRNNQSYWENPNSSTESKLTIKGLAVTTVSCSLSDIVVPMGDTNTQQMFNGVGSRLNPVPFTIHLNNCRAGPNTSVKYQFDPLMPAFDAKNGILALNAGGARRLAATGIGIEIRAAGGTEAVQAFGVPHVFGKITTGENYTIPLNARYIQTAAKITGGIANSAMTFTLIYD